MKLPTIMAGLSLMTWLPSAADTTIDPGNKFAYGANVGWINLEANGSDGVVVGDFFLSGQGYGANVGWISFGDGLPENGVAYSNATASDFGVNHDGAGNLSGFAYGANIGWINFGWAESDHPDRPRLELTSGTFDGFVYGANVGWLNLGAGTLATTTMVCIDSDGDGISDPWERAHFGDLTSADASSDADGDLVSDRSEFAGGSDPNDAGDFFRILSQAVVAGAPRDFELTVEFSSAPSRLYQILVSDDLRTFTDSGLGTFAPGAGATTVRQFPVSGNHAFYRVVAVKPLQP